MLICVHLCDCLAQPRPGKICSELDLRFTLATSLLLLVPHNLQHPEIQLSLTWGLQEL
jgi:hypothetical protein